MYIYYVCHGSEYSAVSYRADRARIINSNIPPIIPRDIPIVHDHKQYKIQLVTPSQTSIRIIAYVQLLRGLPHALGHEMVAYFGGLSCEHADMPWGIFMLRRSQVNGKGLSFNEKRKSRILIHTIHNNTNI